MILHYRPTRTMPSSPPPSLLGGADDSALRRAASRLALLVSRDDAEVVFAERPNEVAEFEDGFHLQGVGQIVQVGKRDLLWRTRQRTTKDEMEVVREDGSARQQVRFHLGGAFNAIVEGLQTACSD